MVGGRHADLAGCNLVLEIWPRFRSVLDEIESVFVVLEVVRRGCLTWVDENATRGPSLVAPRRGGITLYLSGKDASRV